MNIIGHGIDLVDIAEMRHWIKDPRDPLIPRCFVQEELDEVGDGPDRVERLGGPVRREGSCAQGAGDGIRGRRGLFGCRDPSRSRHAAAGAAYRRRGQGRGGARHHRMAAEHQPCQHHGHGERHRDRCRASWRRLRTRLIGANRAEIGDAALSEIDGDPTTARGQDGAPHLKAFAVSPAPIRPWCTR